MSDEMYEPNEATVTQEEILPSYLQEEKITWKDICNHLTGPIISLVIHIIALAVLGTMILSSSEPQREELQVEVKNVDITELPEPPPEQVQPEEVVTEFADVEVERPTVSTDIANVEVTENISVSNTIADVVDMPDTISVKVNNSALKLTGVYASRTDSGRKTSLKQYGGGGTEPAVNKALIWLAKVQNEDGSWGTPKSKDNQPALTAVATLAFLARGETPQSAEHGDTVLKALKKLVSYVDTMRTPTSVIASGGNGYAHAMVAYAVSEGYALTKIPMLERAMNKIIYSIVQGQNDLGGFDYNFGKNLTKVDPKTGKVPNGFRVGDPRCDLSVGGWNYQALKAAFSAGCTVEGLEHAIDKAVECIQKINVGKNGSFCYTNSRGDLGGTASMTSVGTLCLQLMGAGRSSEARNGMKWIENMKVGRDQETRKMDWKNPPSGSMPLYTWYYMTQAIFQGTGGKGRTWTAWNRSFKSVLQKEQDREGFWRSPHDKYRKNPGGFESGAPPVLDTKTGKMMGGGTWTDLGCKVWSTSMCTLMLEVYYRFLPTFKVSEHEGGGSSSQNDIMESFDDLTL